jgi:hypothetical protein
MIADDGWLRSVTVGRQAHKVKPNAKKRMNLRASPHPNSIMIAARRTS